MGRVHPRFKTPHVAIAAQAIWSSVLVLTGTYGVIVSRVVYTEWIFFGALALGTCALQTLGRVSAVVSRRRVSGRRPFCSRSMCLAIVVNQIVGDPRNSLFGLAHRGRRACRSTSSGDDVHARRSTFIITTTRRNTCRPCNRGRAASASRSTPTAIPNFTIPGTTTSPSAAIATSRTAQDVLDELGVAMQVLTLTTPGTHVETPAPAVKLAALVNDEFKEAMDTRGRHFTALATLPLNDPAASAKELERAVRQLGMRGAMLFSNVNGVALSDQRFWPLYEVANDLGAVLYIHPEHPVGVEAMLDYWLMPLVRLPVRHDAGGRLARLQRRRRALIRASTGRCATWAARFRISPSGSTADSRRSRNAARTSTGQPSTYLKTFYYDTVNFDQGALQLAIDFAGADHILAGSDYPHQIGSIPSMLDAIGKLPVTEQERAGIAGGNAARLLG